MVEDFQRQHRLNVDGIAGVQTQIVLDTLSNTAGAPLLVAQAQAQPGSELMSFILDALKKSENERQRQVGPSLADVQVSAASQRQAVVGRRGRGAAGAESRRAARRADARWRCEVERAGQLRANQPRAALRPTHGRARRCRCLRARAACRAAIRQSMQRRDPVGALARRRSRQLRSPALAPNADPHLSAAGNVAGRPADGATDRGARGRASCLSRRSRSRRLRRTEMLPTSTDLAASGTALPDMHLDIHVYSAQAGRALRLREHAEIHRRSGT